jgi:hypothetical protein
MGKEKDQDVNIYESSMSVHFHSTQRKKSLKKKGKEKLCCC